MDNKLTKQIEEWLKTPAEEQDVAAGALLLLKLNRNRFLFNNAMRAPERFREKIVYELNKHLQIRLAGYTLAGVSEMQKKLMPAVAEEVTAETERFKGKREDHDKLPPEVAQLYDDNFELFKKIKLLFNNLKGMEDKPVCDRFELLQLLKRADDEYRANWAFYDAYDPKNPEMAAKLGKLQENVANKVAAARKFISFNNKRLADGGLSPEETQAVMNKMQEKISFILKNRCTFDPDFQEELSKKGFSFQ